MLSSDIRWQAATPDHHVFTAQIEKPAQDTREYRLLRLQNGLQAMLIHDKDADTSAAAMDIAVGHLNDPDDMPGLAHFCEHMLFLGTKQFPKENGYNEYISTHGGHTNAYTGASNTNYYFSVSSTSTPPSSGTSTPLSNGTATPAPRKSPLPRALEMFASFFHSPLFSEAGTARELNAVDSEHKKNSQSDRWRIFQLDKSLSGDIRGPDNAVRKHPWAKFGTGHRGTLSAYGRSVAHASGENHVSNGSGLPNESAVQPKRSVGVVDPAKPLPALPSESDPDGGPVGRETRRRLMEWWEKEYCAGRMRLAIVGRESLDELTQLTTTLFSPIINRSQDPAPLIIESPLGPNEHGTIVESKTVMDVRSISVCFHIPWQSPFYRSKPGSFLGHLVGHEGPGSIHSYLRGKGWSTGVSAGNSGQGRGFSRFSIQVWLTKEGFENQEAVLLTIFKYLSLLRSSPLEKYHHNEISALGEIHFRFTEKERAESYVSDIACSMNKPCMREHILSGGMRVWEWDEPMIRELLDSFKPEKSRVSVLAKEFKDDAGWQHETWYGTEYRVRKMDEKLLKQAQGPNDIPELFLPGPNTFIPTKLDVEKIPVVEPAKKPVQIRDTPIASLWHKKDDQFWVPKGSFQTYVITPLAHLTPRHALKSRMYTDLVNDALTEYSYNASLAGLGYDFGSYDRGVYLSASGYNEKIPILFKTVLETMKNIKISPARFEVIKEDLKQEYENFYLTEPYRIADYWSNYLLAQTAWTPAERLAELETMTVEEVQAHIEQLLSRVYMDSLSTGNLREEEAVDLLTLAQDVLGSRPVTASEKLTERSLILPQGSNYVYKTNVPNPKERELRALCSLLLHMMREPTFDELRTKQQLGYIVFVTSWTARGAMGLRFLLQSEKEPVYLESRVEAFLEAYKTQLAATTLEEFEKQKEGLISHKLEKLENLHSETSRFWSHITSGYCDFLRHENDVEFLRNTSLEDVVTFFNTYVHPDSPSRRKLSVHLHSQSMPSTPGVKFSVPASEAFLSTLKSHGIPVDEVQYRELSKAEPPIEAVRAFWTDTLSHMPGLESANKDGLLGAIEEAAQAHPAQVAELIDGGKAELRPGTVVIEDIARFKASLPLGPAAVPVHRTLHARL